MGLAGTACVADGSWFEPACREEPLANEPEVLETKARELASIASSRPEAARAARVWQSGWRQYVLRGRPAGAFATWCWSQPSPGHYLSYVVGPRGEVITLNVSTGGQPPRPGIDPVGDPNFAGGCHLSLAFLGYFDTRLSLGFG